MSRFLALLVVVMGWISPCWAQVRKESSNTPVSDAVRFLKNYVRINTTNPPGGELAAAEFLRGILVREGVRCEVFVSTPGRANVLARLPSSSPSPKTPLLLLHHMDVVPANAAEWQVDPFAGVEKDGYLWGRGSIDSKITGVLHVQTLLRLKKENVPLDRDILLLATADEEVGGRWGAQWMVENHWDEMKPGFVIDEGGFGFRGVLSSDDRPIYACAVQEKKVLWLRVTARGRSGHGSIPNTDNPNDILRRAILRIEQALIRYGGRPPEVVRDMERVVPHLRRSPLVQAIRGNTLAVTSWLSWSGDLEHPKINVIPAEAVATIDCRLLPDEDENFLLEKMSRAVDDPRVDLQVVVHTVRGSGPVVSKTPLLKSLEKAVRLHDPKAQVVPFLLPEATDSRFFREKGVICHGLVPLVLDEQEYSLLHAVDERVPLDRLESALRIMYDWVKDFCSENKDDAQR